MPCHTHADGNHLSRKLYNTIKVKVLKMPCLGEDSSSPQFVLQSNNENMNGVTAKLIEKFSGLKLEILDDRKSVPERLDDSITDSKAIKNVRNLPNAKISIKEKDEDVLCLSCCKKAESTGKKKIILPLSDVLVSRSPDRNGRRFSREGRAHAQTPNGRRQENNLPLISVNNFRNINGDFTSADLSSQLHFNGGRFCEVDQEIQSLCSSDKSNSLELITNVNFTDDQFSPSSISSSSFPSSPSLYDYISPKSVVTLDPENSENGLSSALDIYPTPPNSALGNTTPFSEDFDLYTENSISECLYDLGAADDKFLQFSYSEDNSLTDVSPLQEKNALDHTSSPKEEIDHIVKYLKNADVNPITSQLVSHLSKSLDKAADSNFDFTDSNKEVKELNSCQEQTFSNKHCEDSSTQLPYIVASHSTVCRSGNILPQQILVMPVQQTFAVLGPNHKNQRPIKPSITPAPEVRVEEIGRCQSQKEPNKTNSVLPGGEFKSVRAKICASITRDEKNKLLKSTFEKKPSENGETNLHLAALEGNEKLMYVLIESVRTKIKSENLETDNPRIYMRQKIQKFVNIQNILGCTPLYHSVFVGNNLLTAYLLECGADPLIKDHENGNTPYHIATMKGDSAITTMELLSYRRDTSDVRNNKGQTILMAAVLNHGKWCSGLELIKHLLSKNHRLSLQDNDGRTALHLAVLKKDIELVKILLIRATDSKAAKLIRDNEGNSILHTAATLNNIEVETHKNLLELIMMHCSSLTEVPNNDRKLPYQIINENRSQERSLLKNKMDEYGYRNL